jgi:hypothetical protein
MTDILAEAPVTESQKERILELASEMRKFEIGLLWQRSLFFWGFIGASFIAYAQFREMEEINFAAIIGGFGLVCSAAWTLQNRGSKYWQEAWEQKVQAVETDVLGIPLFSNPEPREEKGFWGAKRFSVSGLLIALSDFSTLIWLVLLAATLVKGFQQENLGELWLPTVALFLACAYAAVMYCTNKRPDE